MHAGHLPHPVIPPQGSHPAPPPVLQVDHLAVTYKVRGGELEAVQDVSFTIPRGSTCGLVGESGCGKSTVAWSIINFLGANGRIRRGRIRFDGSDLTGQNESAIRRLRGNRMAMVFQDPMQALNPSMRIGDQLKEVLTVHTGLDGVSARQRCEAMLERVHMPDPGSVLRRYPHQLSGGQQQRVVIAMALLNNPALLIMDEPTTALDVTVEAAVLDLVDEIRREFDTAILFITHNLGVVARICDQVGVMYAGQMVELAPVADIFKRPRHPYTQGLIRCLPRLGSDKAASVLHPIPGRVPRPDQRPRGCFFSPRCAYARKRCHQERPLLVSADDKDSAVRCFLADRIDPDVWRPASATGETNVLSCPTAPGDPILALDQLKKYYPVRGNSLKAVLGIGPHPKVKALEAATFQLEPGQTLGIVGESGCGKSTLLKTIIGLESPTDGQARFLGVDITAPIARRDARLVRELQMVFQNPDSTMNPSYTVGQQIARPMRRFKTVPRHQIRDRVVALLRAMRLGEKYIDRLPIQLSGGEKQRIGIARALACRPDLLLCDEPVSALDVSVQAAILNLLLEIQQEFGTTLLFISHDLSVVRFISDLVCVMYLGQIMEIGPAEAIYAPPYHPYTEALLSAVPVPDPAVRQKRIRLTGSVPSALAPPLGCRFSTRCPRRELLPDPAVCDTPPPVRSAGDHHRIHCHLPLSQLTQFEPVIAMPTITAAHGEPT